jgi:hypothetical protein
MEHDGLILGFIFACVMGLIYTFALDYLKASVPYGYWIFGIATALAIAFKLTDFFM